MTAERAGDRVALFPLNVVLFPGGLLPLRIFEPRYQRMVSECLRADQPFAVAAIVDGPEAGGTASTATTGTLAHIIDWEQRDDGLLGLLCEGGQRCQLGRVDVEHDQLLRAEVLRLAEPDPLPLPPDLVWLNDLLGELIERLGTPYDRFANAEPSADHVGARLVELLPLPIELRQALFDMSDSVARLRRLAGLIQPGGDESAPT
jgi:hypothetical protein